MLLTCSLRALQLQMTDAGRVDVNATLWWCQAPKNHVALEKYSIVSIILIELGALRESTQLNAEVKRVPELIKDKGIGGLSTDISARDRAKIHRC
jgi:hypothetical protein